MGEVFISRSKKLYFSTSLHIVRGNTSFLVFIMFFDIAFAATSAIDPSQTYELDDIIRVGIALVVLVSGFLSVIFILW